MVVLDIWWDGRSDFNANGEKALYAGVMYDLKIGIYRAGRLVLPMCMLFGMQNRVVTHL